MQKLTWIPVIVVSVLIILGFVVGRFFYYGGASAYTPPQHELPETEFEASAKSARLEAVDNPVVSQGVVVIIMLTTMPSTSKI